MTDLRGIRVIVTGATTGLIVATAFDQSAIQ